MGINKVILLGHVGKDPEMRQVNNDISVASFSLATSETYMKNGEKVVITEWHRVTAWRKLAEIVDKYVKKGMMLYVEGKIRSQVVEKDGQKRTYYEIVADNIEMLSRVGDGDGSGNRENKTQAQYQDNAYDYAPAADIPTGGDNDTEDDLPF